MQCDGFIILSYDSIDSTQSETKRLWEQNKIIPGTVIISANQTAGYGRRGRQWHSIRGNMAASIILRCKDMAVEQLPYVIGVGLARGVISVSPDIKVNIKWINDILVNDKKIAGILIERLRDDIIIIGFGINIKSPLTTSDKFCYTSLDDLGIQVAYDDFVNCILKKITDVYQEWLRHGFCGIRNEWVYRANGINQKIKINYPNYSEEGIFLGIDDNGYLQLMQRCRIKSISAGEIFNI